ncbi:pantoate--beta-alanine ligase [Wenxinia marina]|uniref:Pantothenate synthetase n=1 Tax=Wenxinia marina DSM 24838 TaxID=1123501 RepID=A0A0D0NGV3_9RHOB|nr:pantoate--beta-alanine ligase [Wenxinia marina]KIQ67565.1 pantothenate synthetase [Wenxinia marina DSM 24838]GGL68434.1 pantothenate synthetase [Wenxinia marina]
MHICRTVADVRSLVAGLRAEGRSVGLVTTMGALHDGHLALVAEARGLYDAVVTTIFVNPTQFGNPQDLDAYPRTEAEDLAKFEAAGVAGCFVPEVGEMYPDGDETIVETTRLAGLFHGAVRPGHFRGVATVVCKLFNIVQPDGAFFGQKDYQQLAVIRRMVTDLHMPLAIHGVATVREADGLAMSSRNVRLSPEDRAAAPVLARALDAAEALAARGATVEEVAGVIREMVEAEPRATLAGLDIVDAGRFLPASGPVTSPVGIMLSAEFGPPDNRVLLIDQRELTPQGA